MAAAAGRHAGGVRGRGSVHAPGVSGPKGGVSAAQVEAEVAGGGEGEEEPPIILDDIFRKTDAKPSLYWLPLSEEEVSRAEWAKG